MPLLAIAVRRPCLLAVFTGVCLVSGANGADVCCVSKVLFTFCCCPKCCLDWESESVYKGTMLLQIVYCAGTLYSSRDHSLILLMSDPAHLFQSLHLDEMPVTRSQAQPSQQRGGRNARAGRGRGRGRGRARAPPPSIVTARDSSPGSPPVQSFTGRQYYTQALSPTSAQRATEGLESNFCVDRVQSHDSGRERYYAFQLRTPVAVRIYEPANGRARMECSCEAHRVTHSECTHMFVRLSPSPSS